MDVRCRARPRSGSLTQPLDGRNVPLEYSVEASFWPTSDGGMTPNGKRGASAQWASFVRRAVVVALGLALLAGSAFALGAPGGHGTVAARHKKHKRKCRKKRVAVYVSHHGHKLGTRHHGRRICIRKPK